MDGGDDGLLKYQTRARLLAAYQGAILTLLCSCKQQKWFVGQTIGLNILRFLLNADKCEEC